MVVPVSIAAGTVEGPLGQREVEEYNRQERVELSTTAVGTVAVSTVFAVGTVDQIASLS